MHELNINANQRACMTKYTIEHVAGMKNPSNNPAPYGLKILSQIAKAKWIEKEKEKANGN